MQHDASTPLPPPVNQRVFYQDLIQQETTRLALSHYNTLKEITKSSPNMKLLRVYDNSKTAAFDNIRRAHRYIKQLSHVPKVKPTKEIKKN